MKTKIEIDARIDELDALVKILNEERERDHSFVINLYINRRKNELSEQLKIATDDDLFTSVLRSHKILCEVKQMDEKAAYGQDPALYYGAGVAGEAGELLNKVVKALRNGNDPEATKKAVISELPDVFIYGVLLAFCLDLDLTKLVSEKAEVVIQRAFDGYYGGPIAGVSRTPQNNKNDPEILEPTISKKSADPIQLEWDWRSRPWEAIDACFSGTDLLGIVWASNMDDAYRIAEKWFPNLKDTDDMDSLTVREPRDSQIKMYESIPLEKRITKNTSIPSKSKERAALTGNMIEQLFNQKGSD